MIDQTANTQPMTAVPQIRRIGYADLKSAMIEGVEDFKAIPTFAVFLCIIYPVIGLLLSVGIFRFNIVPMLFPMMAGFALLGPFLAIALYELSRLREQGQTLTWRNAMMALRPRSIAAILVIAALLGIIFAAWMGAAYAIYYWNFGAAMPESVSSFTRQLLTTPEGSRVIVVGNVVGAVFALLAFVISVVSVPMVVDRDVDASTAILTSVRAVTSNPIVMLQWGVMVAGILAIGALPALVGLAVAVPILGHATWHLYRRLVV